MNNASALLVGTLSVLGLVTIAESAALAREGNPSLSEIHPVHLHPDAPSPVPSAELNPLAPDSKQQPWQLADQMPPEPPAAAAQLLAPTGDAIEQVAPVTNVPPTPVTQLSDVSPGDWAFQSVQSLLARYGCIEGYPDSTFRGEQSATRFEMVAALSACLEKLSEGLASKDQLEALKAFQAEIATMVASLTSITDSLEARTDDLEAQQFSLTTKLQAEVVMGVQYGDFTNNWGFGPGITQGTLPGTVFPPGVPFPPAPPPNDAGSEVLPTPAIVPGAAPPVLGAPGLQNSFSAEAAGSALARVRLSFNTSFSGNDLLSTVLETGNGGLDYFSAIGLAGPASPFPVPRFIADNGRPPLADLGAVDYAGVGDDVTLYRLAYTFTPRENLTLTFGSNVYPSDFFDFNSYANNEAQDFNSGFFINNPLIVINSIDSRGGAGGSVNWNIKGGPVTLRAVYVAASPTVPLLDEGGLFNNPYQLSGEVEYTNVFGKRGQNNFAVRLQGTRFEERANDANLNVLGVNAEVTFGRVGVFGRYGIAIDPQTQPIVRGTTTNLFSAVVGVNPNTNIQTWMAGVGLKDLLVDGSLLAFGVGQPFLVDSNQPRYSPQTNMELFYRFPASDNITLTPAVMLITNPFNIQTFSGEVDNTILQILLRATFSF